MLSPITGKNDALLIRVISPAEISRLWLKEYSIDIGEKFRSLPVIEHWRCNTTGFEWYEPRSCYGEGDLYEKLQRIEWYYMQDKWEFRAALGYFSVGSRLIEVGVGLGYFLQAASDDGLKVAGLELNPAAAEAARHKGYRIYEERLARLAERVGPVFDGVCAFQVLEHVPNPMAFLTDMLSLLRPGGKLVLSVPNATVARFIDPYRTDLLDQPPHHVSHWDERVFRALEKHVPVKILAIEREPLQIYHVDWFVSLVLGRWRKKLGKWAGRILINSFVENLCRRTLRLIRNCVPGHTLLVVYEKRHDCDDVVT